MRDMHERDTAGPLPEIWRRFGRPGSTVFIAWSHGAETEAAAKLIRNSLVNAGLTAWMSDQISPGQDFREDIRANVCRADLVVAVLPRSSSSWQIAEAG